MTREKIDILVHIPLEVEYMEFRELFAIKEEIQDDLNVIAWVNAPSHFKVAVIVQEKMGRSSAAHACQKALQRFEPKLYVCLGIAGGLSKDLKLGDVCYTGSLIDVYDNSKVTDVAGGGVDIALSPEFYASDRRITAAVGFARTLQSLSDLHNFWKEDQQQFAEVTMPDEVIGREDKLEHIGAPKCLNGDIVCGAVSESDKYRERLRGVTRNILAIETESGPVFQMCAEAGIQAITIRGISDYANASKGKLEGDTKESVRRVAARNAVSFFHMQLQSDVFIEAFRKVCGAEQAEPQLELPSQKKSRHSGMAGKRWRRS
jgi:nucleoside phosphorylase